MREEDINRISLGPLGEALHFLSDHILGYSAVAHIRSEIARLLEPSCIAEHADRQHVFPSSSTVAQYARAKSDLDHSKLKLQTLNETSHRYLATMDETRVSIDEANHELIVARTRLFLLEAFVKKEMDQTLRVDALKQRVTALRASGGTYDNASNAKLSSAALSSILQQIEKHFSTQPLNFTEPGNSAIGVTTTIGKHLDAIEAGALLKKLSTFLRSLESKLLTLGAEAEQRTPTKQSGITNILASLHAYHIRLQNHEQTPRATTSTSESRLLRALSHSLKLPVSHPEVIRARDKLLASARTKARRKIREDLNFSPSQSSPDSTVLEEKALGVQEKRRETQMQIDTFNSYLISSTRLAQSTPLLAKMSIHPIRAVLKARGSELQGYVESRARLIGSQVHLPHNEDDFGKEVSRIMKLPRGLTDRGILDKASAMCDHIHRMQNLTKHASIRAAADIDQHDELLQTFLKEQRASEERSQALLSRKIEKVKHGDTLAGDVRAILEERNAILSGKLQGK
ncbi:hypothetical protein BOTBODRAFT_36718 [Botryobasidium botryosum FD-172 SS1]|uniref:Uncharacterized protein n=1 Tax=Botryobasidium botryosum (strain FD-172 SS1) TaxID=930990 RepID=A0A067M2Y6_BOTB1|nr:hypothetical protein BOTBODRAFT_36718 [Botryobasidium botryosum FD-172 SS1]